MSWNCKVMNKNINFDLLANELDELKRQTLTEVGTADAAYIRNVIVSDG